jgi:hypothetical protein
MNNVCRHGQLSRSCQLCDSEKEISELKALNDELLNALKGALHGLAWHAARHPVGMDLKFVEQGDALIARLEKESLKEIEA